PSARATARRSSISWIVSRRTACCGAKPSAQSTIAKALARSPRENNDRETDEAGTNQANTERGPTPHVGRRRFTRDVVRSYAPFDGCDYRVCLRTTRGQRRCPQVHPERRGSNGGGVRTYPGLCTPPCKDEFRRMSTTP